MKPLLPVLAVSVILVGCGDKSGAPAAAGGSTLGAPMEHLKSATAAQQRMVKTVDLTSLNKAIELFQVQEGRLPTNLDELVEKKYIPRIPETPAGTSIQYDAAKGIVTLQPH